LWTLPKGNVTEEEHKEFYQFIARAYDTPLFKLHYATDSPLNIRGLFYFPSQHMEKYGMGRLEPGVNLFSRKVLIQAKAKGILPDWLRFVRGVVDSEDIPLNISREHMQDSSLIQKLNSVLTKRILKFLEEENKKDPEVYSKWYQEFGTFLKEGVCSDFKWKEDIAKLLRFESSKLDIGNTTTLEEYVSRMKPDQKEIYYLVVPGRSYAEMSPYYEGFKSKDLEVLFLYTNMDDFVMSNVGEFGGKKLVSVEAAKIDDVLDPSKKADTDLTHEQVDELCNFIRETLSSKVTVVRETKRLLNTPALIVDHESASYRRMMRYVDPSRMPELPKQQFEINTKHPILKKLYAQKSTHPNVAKEVTEQLFDNALVAAGLLDDSRGMLQRLNKLLEKALDAQEDIASATTGEQQEDSSK
jgi:HSP90 family molecular chaperone